MSFNINVSSENEWVLQKMGFSCPLLLPETSQHFLSHSWATFGLREEAVETLSMACRVWICTLTYWNSWWRRSFHTDMCSVKCTRSAWTSLESSGKVGGDCHKMSRLVCFSTHLPELGLEFRIALQLSELHLKHSMAILDIDDLSLCVLKSTNLWSNSSSSFTMPSAYFSPWSGQPASMSAFNARKRQRFVERAGLSIKLHFVENAFTLS